jgi:hypothetical protein
LEEHVGGGTTPIAGAKTVAQPMGVSLSLCAHAVSAEPAVELDLEACKENQAIDAFLRNASPLYAAMARLVEFHGGYRIEDEEGIEGGCWYPATRTIAVSSRLQGAERATIVAFEMTNAHQQRLHHEVDRAVAAGTITTESEFALRHELVEYDGLTLHREVLREIEQSLGELPPAFFFFVSEKPGTVAEYRLPPVTDFVAQMESSGHSKQYRQWFRKNSPRHEGDHGRSR